jgi:chromosome segregation ATPase
VAKVQG